MIKLHLVALCIFTFFSSAAFAHTLPSPEKLEDLIKNRPSSIKVYEPHMSPAMHPIAIEYVGFPLEVVLSKVFGPAWGSVDGDYEFRALDGYASRVSPNLIKKYHPYLVFQRMDGRAFKVQNVHQHQKDISLGPYYLVWDNIKHKELLEEGPYGWPYQINEIVISHGIPEALVPNKKDKDAFIKEIKLTQKYCLNCHQLNGLGGSKYPNDLSESAKKMGELEFIEWVTSPDKVKENSAMPAINKRLPEKERHEIALEIYHYLIAF